ncbi:MAG: hypothetical protein AB7G76_10355 [Steroidobacteraceae bacterium]
MGVSRRLVSRWLVAAAAATCVPARLPAQSAPGSERVTVDIELESCGKVLRRVARLFSAGFTRKEADRLARTIDAQATDVTGQWTYQVTSDDGAATLTVRALVDELSMVDLDFVTTPALAGRIRKALGDVER